MTGFLSVNFVLDFLLVFGEVFIKKGCPVKNLLFVILVFVLGCAPALSYQANVKYDRFTDKTSVSSKRIRLTADVSLGLQFWVPGDSLSVPDSIDLTFRQEITHPAIGSKMIVLFVREDRRVTFVAHNPLKRVGSARFEIFRLSFGFFRSFLAVAHDVEFRVGFVEFSIDSAARAQIHKFLDVIPGVPSMNDSQNNQRGL